MQQREKKMKKYATHEEIRQISDRRGVSGEERY